MWVGVVDEKAVHCRTQEILVGRPSFAYPSVRSIAAARGKLPREQDDITGSEWAGWRNEPEQEPEDGSTAPERGKSLRGR